MRQVVSQQIVNHSKIRLDINATSVEKVFSFSIKAELKRVSAYSLERRLRCFSKFCSYWQSLFAASQSYTQCFRSQDVRNAEEFASCKIKVATNAPTANSQINIKAEANPSYRLFYFPIHVLRYAFHVLRYALRNYFTQCFFFISSSSSSFFSSILTFAI